jgi:hypothetical protein
MSGLTDLLALVRRNPVECAVIASTVAASFALALFNLMGAV